MMTLDEIEARKARTVLVFASSAACAPAIVELIAQDNAAIYELAFAMTAAGASNAFARKPGLHELVLGPDRMKHSSVSKWPRNVHEVTGISELRSELLVSASEILWFYDAAEATPPAPGSGAYWCALNVALGAMYGMPWSCRDTEGQPRSSPLFGSFALDVVDALNRELEERRRFTDTIRREGIVLRPGCGEPVLWAGGRGGLALGTLDLPPDATWRLRRLEMFVDEMPVAKAWPEDAVAVVRAEKETCAALVRSALQTKVSLKWAFPPE